MEKDKLLQLYAAAEKVAWAGASVEEAFVLGAEVLCGKFATRAVLKLAKVRAIRGRTVRVQIKEKEVGYTVSLLFRAPDSNIYEYTVWEGAGVEEALRCKRITEMHRMTLIYERRVE